MTAIAPGTISPRRPVPEDIARPEYVDQPAPAPYDGPEVKDAETLENNGARYIRWERGDDYVRPYECDPTFALEYAGVEAPENSAPRGCLDLVEDDVQMWLSVPQEQLVELVVYAADHGLSDLRHHRSLLGAPDLLESGRQAPTVQKLDDRVSGREGGSALDRRIGPLVEIYRNQDATELVASRTATHQNVRSAVSDHFFGHAAEQEPR